MIKPYTKNDISNPIYIMDVIVPNNRIIVHKICLRNWNGNLYSIICSKHQIMPAKMYIATIGILKKINCIPPPLPNVGNT